MARPRSSKGDLNATLSIKLDLKARYGLDLLARKQRMTLSSFIENLIEARVNDRENGLYKEIENKNEYLLNKLWSVNPAQRLVNLWRFWPELIRYEEEKMLHVIVQETGFHIRRKPKKKSDIPIVQTDNPLESINGKCVACVNLGLKHEGFFFDAIAENWEKIEAKASGDNLIEFDNLKGIMVAASHKVFLT